LAHAHAGGDGQQHGRIGQVAPLEEEGFEQRLGHCRLAVPFGSQFDEGMSRQRVRLTGDLVELQFEADAPAGGAHALDDGRHRVAELASVVLFTRHALGRQVGIELVDAPAHLGRRLVGPGGTPLRQRGIELALADETPGADDVRDDVDLEHGAIVDQAGRLSLSRPFLGGRGLLQFG